MYALMIYTLKVGVCLTLFYLCFKVLLSRETFHRVNRVVVLASLVLSFALPLCVVTVYREPPALSTPAAELMTPILPVVEMSEPASFAWERVAGALFMLGVVVALLRTLRSLFAVWSLIRGGRREPLDDGMVLVRRPEPLTPFSWYRYIVISEADLSENGAEIVLHECAHLRLHHSVDLLITDFAACLQWFNPAMWLLRRELRAIHEYQADASVIESGADARHYQLLLVRKAVGGSWCSIANSFNHSKLKTRIAMMLREKSPRWAIAKVLFILPLTALALASFARTAYVFPEGLDVKNSSAASLLGEDSLSVAPNPIVVATSQNANGLIGTPVCVKYEAWSDATKRTDIRATNGQLYMVNVNGESLIDLTAAQTTPGKKMIYIVNGREMEERFFKNIMADKIQSIEVQTDPEKIKQYTDKTVDGAFVVTLKLAPTAAEARQLSDTVVAKTNSPEPPQIWINKLTSPKPNRGSASDTTARSASSTIHIRGIGGDNADGAAKPQPLIMVDGVKIKVQKLEDIDPADIESISVLKNAEATKQYGSEAAAGVVLITTKKEKK